MKITVCDRYREDKGWTCRGRVQRRWGQDLCETCIRQELALGERRRGKYDWTWKTTVQFVLLLAAAVLVLFLLRLLFWG